MSTIKCIYCGSEDNLTVSDIIPYGLTNKKVTNGNVCSYHNQKINNDAESYVINELNYLRYHLGIVSRKQKKIIEYNATIEIGDKKFNERLSSKEDFFKKKIISTEVGSKKFVAGPIKFLKRFKNKYDIQEITLNNIFVNMTILNTGLLKSEQMFRMVAKISYEWYCKINNINLNYKVYQNIIDYITNGIKPNYNIVEIVVNESLYKQLNGAIFLGNHALSTTYKSDGEVYVLYSFFGLIIYKVKLCSNYPIRLLNDRRTDFYCITLDGTEMTLQTPKLLVTPDIMSKDANTALKLLDKHIADNIKLLVTTHIITIRNLKRPVEKIEKILSEIKPDYTNDEITFELIEIREEMELSALFILGQLGKHFEDYDFNKSFNGNLKKILSTDEFFHLNQELLLNQLVESCRNGQLVKDIQKGLHLFNSISGKALRD